MSDNLSKATPVPAGSAVGRALRLTDLSGHDRWGLKGPEAPNWLSARLPSLPAPNQAMRTDCGQLLARLSPEEFVLLNWPGQDSPAENKLQLPAFTMDGDVEPGLVPVPREAMSCWFHLEGAPAALDDFLSRLCGIDLRQGSFPNLGIAQTSIARTNAILIADRAPGTERGAFHLLADWSTGHYLWTVLEETFVSAS